MTIGWGMPEHLVKQQCKRWYEFRSGDFIIGMFYMERSWPNNDPAWMIVKFLNNEVVAFSHPILIEEFEEFESEVRQLGDGAWYIVEQKRLDFLTPHDLENWQAYILNDAKYGKQLIGKWLRMLAGLLSEYSHTKKYPHSGLG